jgi:hypothetical protein
MAQRWQKPRDDNGQTLLFDEQGHVRTPKLPAEATETQIEAARAVEPRTGTQRHKVLSFLRLRCERGATDQQISDELALGLNSVRPRRLELVEAGLVIDSGRRRETSTGCLAQVWVALEYKD